MIDWDVAVSTGTRFARPGPQVSLAEARQTVAELRELSMAVERPVREVTGLQSKVAPGKVAVVDRAGWIRANVDGFKVVLDPLAEQMRQRTPAASAGGLVMGVGSRITGAQAGLMLSYLSSRVLGQYELFLPPGTDENGAEPVGRLTLVAPNIVMVERELEVNPRDFRRWVCLHEETHRVQFTSVPWLRAYVQDQMSEFLLASELDPGAIFNRLRAAAEAVAGAVRGGESESLIEAVQTPRQREILARLTALMTLVEGHGDYVMDAVGPQVVPTVAQIRERFNARRANAGRVEQTIRRILGIDLKMKQYAQGSRFVRTVVDAIGMEGFNRVWDSPETIPTMAEINDPRSWITRVAASYVTPAALTGTGSAEPVTGPVTGGAPAPGSSPAGGTGPTTSNGASNGSSNGAATDGGPRAEDISLEEFIPPAEPTPATDPVTPAQPATGSPAPAGSATPADTASPAETVSPADTGPRPDPAAPAGPWTPADTAAPADPAAPADTGPRPDPAAPAGPWTPADTAAPADPAAPADTAAPTEPGDAFHADSDAAFGEPAGPGDTSATEIGPTGTDGPGEASSAETDRPADGTGPADPSDQPGA
jgi:coenzyme F420 biosynthesis associated uncharacterized protein